MNNECSIPNYILDQLTGNQNKYVPFIVKRRQMKLIEILDDAHFLPFDTKK